jgi:hypothetical protein
MATREDLLAALATDPDLCDLGYAYAEFDRPGYCLWVADCARHLFPLVQRHLGADEMAQLTKALDQGERFLAGEVDSAAMTGAIAVPRRIGDSYLKSHGTIPLHLAETLEAVANALELTLPDSRVYHEDVIYAAARAALAGRLHPDEVAAGPDASDCNDPDELAGSEESEQEKEWQRNALKRRLAPSDLRTRSRAT